MLQTAIKAAKLAGNLILENSKDIGTIKAKENIKSIVTKSDVEAEKIIINTIKEKYPDHNFLGEELGNQDQNSEYTWIIDPIDGTSNFAQNIPMYVVSIGLKKSDQIILGVIYNPMTDDLYQAELGKGAFLNNKKIEVSKKDKISDSVVVASVPSSEEISLKTFKMMQKLFPKIRAIRLYGSAAINLCYVACGKLDAYFTYSIKPWDVAAGYIIVKEAGGIVTNLKGSDWQTEDEPLLATNGKLHKEFLNQIK
jgi:myo-inositol-1(or 4)-monophosphatase